MIRTLVVLTTVTLFGVLIWQSWHLHDIVHERKALMEDYAEINKANYELFNIELWKEQTLDIINERINTFEISPATYQMLDGLLKGYLNDLHTRYITQGELADVIISEVKTSGKVNAFLVKVVEQQVPTLVKDLDLRPQIPGLSANMIAEIKANEPLIMEYVRSELLRLVMDNSTRNLRDRRQGIFEKYNTTTAEEADIYLLDKINALDMSIRSGMITLIGAGLLVLLSCVLLGQAFSGVWMISSLTVLSVILLVLGVSMPMIDIDARLSSFGFTLMDQDINFDEQIIYYQSKSIVEVTQTLWRGGTWDLKLVGVLVIMFSVIFPTIKLILSGLYLFTERIRKSQLVKKIIFHLGKWSMADVFVVAIFMAYIGFYGILSSQLNALDNSDGFAIETVNYSKISPGVFFFTSYVILSIIISTLISKGARYHPD